MVCGSRQATAETYGDYEYNVLDDGTVEITKYNGDADEVVIPSRINGKNVTSIGGWAFADNDDFTSVTIPDGVKAIGDSAFSACFYLQSVTIPGSVTTIGESAFSCCEALGNVVIRNGVTTIGAKAFDYCDVLSC
ncbi:MAG: leucine-rich repeat domain-containing protein, partial [Ruminococcus sp.]|nr:leucine-rich repeat domain-containing protein [Ruminococcus sp.]